MGTYTYTPTNRIATSQSATRAATTSYTADDGRILQVINGTTKHTVRGVGTDVLSEYINGAWNKDSIYLGSRLLGEVRSTGLVRYFGTDQLGSMRVVFDAAGAVIGRSDYLPFGEGINASGTLPIARFTGQERDQEGVLDYFEARMHQPRTGRFNAPDPVLGNPADPQSWNRYVYVRNNPLRFTDPSGMIWCQGPSGGVTEFSDHKSCPEGMEPFVLPRFEDTTTVTAKPKPEPPGPMREPSGVPDPPLREDRPARPTPPCAGGNCPTTDVIEMSPHEAIGTGAVLGFAAATKLEIFRGAVTALRVHFVAAGVKAALTVGNKWNHVFNNAQHKLHRAGSPSDVLNGVSRAVAKAFVEGTISGTSWHTRTVINGVTVEIRGGFSGGAPRVGTAYVIP